MRIWRTIPLPFVAMWLSLGLLAAFQVYWLARSMEEAKEGLQQELTNLLISEVYKLQDSSIQTKVAKKWMERHPEIEDTLWVFNGSMSRPRIQDSMPAFDRMAERVRLPRMRQETGKFFITLDSSAHTEIKVVASKFTHSTSIKTRDSLPASTIDLEINLDTLSMTLLEEVFTARLKLKKIPLPVQLVKTQKGLPPTQGQIIVGPIPVDFPFPSLVYARFYNYMPFLIRRVTPQIAFSVVLIGLTAFSFWLIWHNLMKQRRLTDMKNEFISNMTHELKTPIATVGVAIEALQHFDGLADPLKAKEYLDISNSELKRLALLVDKVLKISQFEQKALQTKMEKLDLAPLVESVMRSLRLQFEHYRAEVQFVAGGDEFWVKGDPTHLANAVYNLLDNALKYGGDTPAIQLNLSKKEPCVILSVSDKGPGIPPEYAGKVFEKFFRIPAHDRHNVKGHGLGLSYVASIVKQHDGQIHLESKPGKGCSFTISIPYYEA